MEGAWAQVETLLVEFAARFGVRLLSALGTLVLGLAAISIVTRWLRALLARREVDPALQTFLGSILAWTLRVALVITVASMVGIEMVSFVAVLGAMGFAIGMALQGSLSNFAGGVLILLFRPFRVGDFIEAQGFSGTVARVDIFHTVLKTGDNRTIVLPNGALANGSIVNFSAETRRRVDVPVGIDYGADIARAKEVVLGVLAADPRVLKDPAPAVVVTALADSSVNLVGRAWVAPADFWPVHSDNLQRVKEALDAAGIGIPFPQRVVHVVKDA